MMTTQVPNEALSMPRWCSCRVWRIAASISLLLPGSLRLAESRTVAWKVTMASQAWR